VVKHAIYSLVAGILITAALVQAQETPSSVPLKLGRKHAILLPVKIGEVDAQFLLDTGLGFDLISPQLAQKLGLEATPDYQVRPVTGGELKLGRAKLSSLAVGKEKETDLEVLVGDPGKFVGNGGETQVDGILSLAFFKERPFTLDFANQQLVLEDRDSLAKRKAAGKRVGCRLSDEKVVASVPLTLTERAPDPPKPGGIAGILSTFTGSGGAPDPPKAWVQVHTGHENLLLNSRLMFTLKVDATGANITETEPTDPTGQRFRSWASHMGRIELEDHPTLRLEKAPVVFRKLEAEGVLGQDFLRRYTVTFNLPDSELFFSP